MVVTINTDASFSEKHSVGAYAFWIKCDRYKLLKSGILRKRMKRPEVAEFRCIINALYVTLKQGCKDVKLIIINTDCLSVIHIMTDNKDAISRYGLWSWGNYLKSEFNRHIIENKYKGKIEFRHVAAHTGISDNRSYVNEWCDTEAKKMLKLAIIQRFLNQN